MSSVSKTNLFVRIGSRPQADLERGYSYSMGCFGDESEAHPGLSAYAVDTWTLEGALVELHERMGIVGSYADNATGAECEMFVCVFRGTRVGMGPDSEDLCRPDALVFAIDTRSASSVDEMIELVQRKLV